MDAQETINKITAMGFTLTVDVHGPSEVQCTVWGKIHSDGMQERIAGATGRTVAAAVNKCLPTLRKWRKNNPKK